MVRGYFRSNRVNLVLHRKALNNGNIPSVGETAWKLHKCSALPNRRNKNTMIVFKDHLEHRITLAFSKTWRT